MKKRSLTTLLVLALVLTAFGVSSTQESLAFGRFLKNKAQNAATSEVKKEASEATQAEDASPSAQNTTTQSSEPVVYQNSKYHYTFTYPGNWTLDDSDPKKSTVTVIDTNGQMGNMIASSTWMNDNFPVDPAFNALVQKAEQRKKHGELDEYYVKKITKNGKDIVKGVVIVESDIDPDMKRMQWEAYGGGNYYNFTWSTNVAKFPSYKEAFNNMLDSIDFNFPM